MFNLRRVQNDSHVQESPLHIYDIDQEIGKKLFLPCFLKFENSPFQRSVALIDSGADLSLCQAEYFYRLFPKYSKEYLLKQLTSTSIKLSSYTSHDIHISGIAKISMKLLNSNRSEDIDLYIVESPGQSNTPMIFSLQALSKFDIQMKFQEINHHKEPYLTQPTIRNTYTTVPSFYYTDAQLSHCHSYANHFQSKEIRKLKFIVSPATALVEDDKVLVTQDNIPYMLQPDLRILPSTSTLQIEEDELVATALVKNIGKHTFQGAIKASVELCAEETVEIKTIKYETYQELEDMNITLVNECYPPHENEIAIKQINIQDLPRFTRGSSGCIPTHLYSLDVMFPEHTYKPSNGEAVNNDVKSNDKALSEERFPVTETPNNKSKEELKEYYQPEHSIQIGLQDNLPPYTRDQMIPKGLSIPTSILQTPADIVKREKYSPETWNFVEDIFINKYPGVLARHSLDTGRISDTLGYYTIRLKDNVVLPKYKKIFYNAPFESSAMRDILESLLKQEVIIKASCAGGDIPNFSSPAFLVKRSSPSSSARLVVDFKLVNECIATEPISIPNFNIILNDLRDCAIYSSLDLKNAFNSIGIDPASRPLTQFVCQFGSYYFTRLPTGMNISPNMLNRFCDKMINFLPKRDSKNKVIYNEKGYPIMEADKLEGCQIYYDDLIIYTKPQPTYEETLKVHFRLVETVVSRLAFHSAKIDMNKVVLGKAKISFLGWIISNNFLIADPKRVEKLKNVTFPHSTRGMRSFIGLVNSLRQTLGFHILRHVHELTPLTSTKLEKFEPREEHHVAFNKLLEQLTTAPLFSKICLPGVPKIICTDAASEAHSSFSAVLLQHVAAKNPKEIVPPFLYLDDPTHRIIYDFKLPCKPIPIIKDNEGLKEYRTRLEISNPPEFDYLSSDTFGYGENFNNSFGISLQCILMVQRCSTDYQDTCLKISQQISKSIIFHQLLSNEFQNDKQRAKNYLYEVRNGTLSLDKNLYIIRAASIVLNRTIKVVNSTSAIEGTKLISFDSGSGKPPFFFLLYEIKGRLVTRPTFLDAHGEYSLARHRGSLEVILYYTQIVPEEYRKLKILDLELFSLLSSLQACKKLIGGDELLALVDSKALYYQFHNETRNSCVRVQNWGRKITDSFPNIKLAFIGTNRNPADFLSRRYDIAKPELTKLHLPVYVNDLLDDYIPKDRVFTLNEWINWVNENNQFIEYCTPIEDRPKLHSYKVATVDVALKYSNRNVSSIFNPIRSLEKILTQEKIIQKQQEEFIEIYQECAKSPNHILTKEETTYSLNHGILYIETTKSTIKMMIPTTLLPAYIAMSHLACNHSGYERMVTNLENYHHEDINKMSRRYARVCFACQVVNPINRHNKLGVFPLTSEAGQILYLDLMENIGKSGQKSKFQHILLVKDPISNFMLLLPMRTKTAEEFLHVFITNVFQILHPKQIWSDNGPLFSSKLTIRILALIGVQMIYSSAYSPLSHGSIEVMVRVFKTSMRKYLSTEKDLNWSLMAPVIAHIHNSSKIVKSKYSPYEIIFGQDNHLSTGYLDQQRLPVLHPAIQKEKEALERKNKNLKNIMSEVKQRIEKERDVRIEKGNRTRVRREFVVGDIAFVKDRSQTAGSTKPLRTRFYLEPFVILYIKPTTVLIQRLSDGLILNRHKNDIKKYIEFSEDFQHLPNEVLRICQQETYNITSEQLEDLLKVEDLDIEKFGEDEEMTDQLINEDFLPPLPDDESPETAQQELYEDEEDTNQVTTRSQTEKTVTFQDQQGEPQKK